MSNYVIFSRNTKLQEENSKEKQNNTGNWQRVLPIVQSNDTLTTLSKEDDLH